MPVDEYDRQKGKKQEWNHIVVSNAYQDTRNDCDHVEVDSHVEEEREQVIKRDHILRELGENSSSWVLVEEQDFGSQDDLDHAFVQVQSTGQNDTKSAGILCQTEKQVDSYH